MFTRFRQNVSRWPRTFAGLLLLAGLYEVASYLSALHQGLATLVAYGITLGLAIFVYVWFMGNPVRVGLLLGMLDNFEGRKPIEPCNFLMSVDHYGDEVRCTLPKGHEGGHLEEIETCVDENPEEEEIDAT